MNYENNWSSYVQDRYNQIPVAGRNDEYILACVCRGSNFLEQVITVMMSPTITGKTVFVVRPSTRRRQVSGQGQRLLSTVVKSQWYVIKVLVGMSSN